MSASYINPALPSMIRGLYKADLREKSIQNMLDLAADLVQELIDTREQADREPVRQLQECSVCGERVPVSHATDEWEKRHGRADREPSDAEVEAAYELTVDMLEDPLVASGASPAEHGIEIRTTAGALVYKIRAALLAAQEVRDATTNL